MTTTPSLGRFGVWVRRTELPTEFTARAESAGFGAVWVGLSPRADLAQIEEQLDASKRIPVVTSIVNVWGTTSEVLAESYHRVNGRHPGRLVVGIGAAWAVGKGEPPMTPYRKIVATLDELDALGVPREHLMIATLGPRMLRLAAERTAGANPYLVTPEHTRFARQHVGEGLVAPVQWVAFENDPAAARETARGLLEYYVGIPDYRRNLTERLGFDAADLEGRGSDRLADALTASGGPDGIRAGLEAHLDAGADHVAAQLLVPGDAQLDGIDRLADILGLEGSR